MERAIGGVHVGLYGILLKQKGNALNVTYNGRTHTALPVEAPLNMKPGIKTYI